MGDDEMKDLADKLAFQIKVVRTLPLPLREHVFARPRMWRFDLAWLQPKIAVECEGGIYIQGAHTRGAHFESDCEKYAEAMIRGWRVLRVTRKMIDSGAALKYIEELINTQK